MADDPAKTAADRKRIDVSQDHECRYWSEKWNVPPDTLKRAAAKAGRWLPTSRVNSASR